MKFQFPADLVIFTGEILNGKLHFLCSALSNSWIESIKYNQKGGLKVQTLVPLVTIQLSSETYCQFKNYKPYVQVHILVIKPNVEKLKWGASQQFFQKYFFKSIHNW